MTGASPGRRPAGLLIRNSQFAIRNSPGLPRRSRAKAAFTMIEIAICLAIIGFALVAIIGVLPYGMNTQRDNREETVINQDATVLLETIRSGALGADTLTNNIYAITNYWALYNTNGSFNSSGINGYTYSGAPSSSDPSVYPAGPYSSLPITNGVNLIGLLSTPQYIADTNNSFNIIYPAVPGLLYAAQRYGMGCYSNHVIAYVRSISGLAAEKPPQNNPIMVGDTFTYRVYCVNAAMAVDTNNLPLAGFGQQLAAGLHELRLTFLWPQLPNGNLGAGHQTFRTAVAGQLAPFFYYGQPLYYYQPQSFTNAP